MFEFLFLLISGLALAAPATAQTDSAQGGKDNIAGPRMVTLYLLPQFVTRLVPKLRAELAPGSRVVSHDYRLSPWPPVR